MKISVLFIAVLFCVPVFSQGYGDNEPYNPEPKVIPTWKTDLNKHWNIKNKTDSLQYELCYMRYCLGKYHEVRSTGRILMGGGIAITTVGYIVLLKQLSTTLKSGEVRNTTASTSIIGIGGLCYTAGGIVCLCANKWIKRSAIRPSRYGIGVEYNF